MFKIIECNKPNISKIKFECDDEIHPKLNEYPLTKSFFNKSNSTVFLGKPGSGKTSLMINFITKIYKKKFNKVYVFMPETSRKSLKNNIFEKYLPPNQLYEELNYETATELYELVKNNSMDGLRSLIIFDDVQRALKDYDTVKLIHNLLANRRHLKICVFFLLQNYFSLDNKLRDLVDNIILFKMNKKEQERIFNEVIESHKDKFDEIQALVFNEPYKWLFVNKDSQRIFSGFDEIIKN